MTVATAALGDSAVGLTKKSSRQSLRQMPSVSSVRSAWSRSSRTSLLAGYQALEDPTDLLEDSASSCARTRENSHYSTGTSENGTARRSTWKGSVDKTFRRISNSKWTAQSFSSDGSSVGGLSEAGKFGRANLTGVPGTWWNDRIELESEFFLSPVVDVADVL